MLRKIDSSDLLDFDISEQIFFALEGNIAVGKTYILNALLNNFPEYGVFIEDVANYTELVKNFYEDKLKWGYVFQVSMLWRKAKNMRQALFSDKKINIIERVVDSNYEVFAKKTRDGGFISEDLFREYKNSFDDISYFLKPPNFILYLKADMDFLYKRVSKRGRAGENKISKEYLMDLDRRYDKWINDMVLKGNYVIPYYVDHDLSLGEIKSLIDSSISKYREENKK